MTTVTSDPVLDAIASLDARLARLERAVAHLTDVLEQVPALGAMAADAADEEIRGLQARGVDVDDRVRRAVVLTERLTRPEVLTTLERLTDQAVAMEGTLGMVADIADEWAHRLADRTGAGVDERARGLVDLALRASEPKTLATLRELLDHADTARDTLGMGADILDELVAGLAADGEDPEQRIQAWVSLVRRLSAPGTVALVHKVLDKSDVMEKLLDTLLAAPDTLGMMLDAWDEFLAEAEKRGLELDLLLDRVLQVAVRTGRLVGSDELQELIDSYILDPGAVRTVSLAANALAETRAEPAGRAGVWAALSALSDPQVQAALDFAIRFGRRFGGAVSQGRDLPARH